MSRQRELSTRDLATASDQDEQREDAQEYEQQDESPLLPTD
jgi:hypothetical protein